MKKENMNEEITTHENPTQPNLGRRSFLQFAGVGVASVALLAAGCKKDSGATITSDGIYLGDGDIGVLNYAFALEQLEAAFYIKAVKSSYFTTQASADEKEYLMSIRDHEVAHREFFSKVLGTSGIIDLEFDFSSIDFSTRDAVLGTAKVFEDLGVSAYNGAGKLITNPTYLELAGKIVSVEARHAAILRDLISLGTFADRTSAGGTIDTNGLDLSRTPKEVLTLASKYIKNKINANGIIK